MSKEQKSFVIYDSWATLFTGLPQEQAGELIKMICCYKLGLQVEDGSPTVMAMFEMIKRQLDDDAEKYAEICRKRAENGRAGGLAKAKQNIANAKQMLSNAKNDIAKASNTKHYEYEYDNEYDNDNVYDNVNVNEKESINAREEKEVKHKYGEYKHVLLTDREYELLWNDFGEEMTAELIKILDEAIETKGYKYNNCYLIIRGWVLDEYNDRQKKKNQQGKSRDKPQPKSFIDIYTDMLNGGGLPV